MNTNKEETPVLASENVIFRIVSAARIISWVLLVFYLVSFVNDLSGILRGQMSWPTQLSQWPITLVSLFFAPVIGLFYFLVLQGVAQGLSLGLDLYYELRPEEEEREEEEKNQL